MAAQLIEHVTTDPEINDSSPATYGNGIEWQKGFKKFGCKWPTMVAQLIEHLTPEPEIKDSYPATFGNRRKWQKDKKCWMLMSSSNSAVDSALNY